jgi:hypothetical protein
LTLLYKGSSNQTFTHIYSAIVLASYNYIYKLGETRVLHIPNMNLHFSSSILTSNINPIFGSRGTSSPYTPLSFGGVHIPQPTPTVRGWNPPSSKPNPRYNSQGWSAQMGGPCTSYIPSIHPSSTMLVPMNTFLMENLPLTYGVPSGGSQFYSMGNPPHRFPSFGGNIYPHMSNPYHAAFSSHAASSMMIPLQTFMS